MFNFATISDAIPKLQEMGEKFLNEAQKMREIQEEILERQTRLENKFDEILKETRIIED